MEWDEVWQAALARGVCLLALRRPGDTPAQTQCATRTIAHVVLPDPAQTVDYGLATAN